MPIYIKGTDYILKPGRIIIKPGKVNIRIGKEIQTSSYQPNKVLDLMNDLKESIMKLQVN